MADRSDVNPAVYETILSDEDEKKFWPWLDSQYKQKTIGEGDYNFYKAKNFGYDYDMRAAFQNNKEITEIGKKPNNTTFTIDSKWAKDAPGYAGHWDNDLYVPPVNEKLYIPEVHGEQ